MLSIDEAISHCLEAAGEQQERADSAELIDILDGLDVESCKQCATDYRQLAEWLTELKEWKENPFLQIRTECRNNYYCNNCAFINHCPFANGNRVVAEYPMDWVVYY